jgi:hypothetical protein
VSQSIPTVIGESTFFKILILDEGADGFSVEMQVEETGEIFVFGERLTSVQAHWIASNLDSVLYNWSGSY